MSNKSRYVFDTNVIVSALLFEQGNPGQAFYKALDEAEILLSEEVVREIKDVLSREKFDRYIAWNEREQFLQLLIPETTLIEITEEIQECRDPKYGYILFFPPNFISDPFGYSCLPPN